jgi:hypothetical protein
VQPGGGFSGLGTSPATGVRALLDAQPSVTPDGGPPPLTATLAPALAFEDVGFAYPGGRAGRGSIP